MADKFLIRLFQPIAAVNTDSVLQFAITKNGVATRTLLADLDDAGLFRATSFGIYGGSNGTDFSGIPGSITVAKGIVTAASAGFVDTNFLIVGSSDATKKLRFEVDGFTTATTRMLTPLNKDYTIEETGHQSKHVSGGSDSIKLDDLAAPDDNTDLNATTSAHGLLLKLNNSATNFLNGQGAWAAVKDSDVVFTDIATNNSSTSNHGYLKKLDNDGTHFMDGTGNWANPGASAVWTLVLNEAGTSLTNWTQAGSWSVASSAFHIDTGATTVRTLRYTPRIANSALVFQCDVKMVSTGGFAADNRVGFQTSTGSTPTLGTLITIRSTGALTPASTGTIYVEHPAGITAGAGSMTKLFSLDTFYTLRIVAIGTIMDVYFDGTYMYSFPRTVWTTQTTIDQSYVGLYAYNCRADFKNIKMWTYILP